MGDELTQLYESVRGDNPWERTGSARELTFGTLTGVIDQIDYRLGRPGVPPSRDVVASMAMEFAANAVDKSPHRDFGEKSEQMRQSIVNTIVKGYFDEMEARKRWTA